MSIMMCPGCGKHIDTDFHMIYDETKTCEFCDEFDVTNAENEKMETMRDMQGGSIHPRI